MNSSILQSLEDKSVILHTITIIDPDFEDSMFEDFIKLFKDEFNAIVDNNYYRQNGWYYTEYTLETGETGTITYHPSNNYADISYNKIYISKNNEGLPIIKLFDRFRILSKGFSGPYPELAKELEMTDENIKSPAGFRSFYSRDKMSYGEGFKYFEQFKRSTKMANYINKLNPDYNIQAVFIYYDDTDILLVRQNGFNFITTIEMLSEDLEIKSSELKLYL